MRVNCVAFLSGKASRVILFAAFSLGAAASAFAFTPTEAQKEACTPDAFRLCSSEIPDIGRVTACMSAKKASLSPPCRAVFAAAAGETAPRPHHQQRIASAHVQRHHEYRIHSAYEHRHHEHRIRSAYEHRHHEHEIHSARAHHHHSAHWKRYAYNHTHEHHRWAGR
jgi:hypothetical protein